MEASPLMIPMTEHREAGSWKAAISTINVSMRFTQWANGLNEVLLIATRLESGVPCYNEGACPFGRFPRAMDEGQLKKCVAACPQKHVGDTLMLRGVESFEDLRLEALASCANHFPSYHPALVRPWILCDC